MGNTLYLLKSDKTRECVNTKMEVLASQVLECFENKIDSITYESDTKNMLDGEGQVSICKNFVGEEYSFVEAWEAMDYCRASWHQLQEILYGAVGGGVCQHSGTGLYHCQYRQTYTELWIYDE